MRKEINIFKQNLQCLGLVLKKKICVVEEYAGKDAKKKSREKRRILWFNILRNWYKRVVWSYNIKTKNSHDDSQPCPIFSSLGKKIHRTKLRG